ncbi:MAG TPA: hypothetical protein VKA46_42865 [Gemmataceae bacterium]|nr:hypothetical protein [Gemmataceae bacterium]
MKESGRLFWMVVGIGLGALGVAAWSMKAPPALAGTADRHEDFVMCTGSVSTNPRAPTDGVWLLDYHSGKLLATVIDRDKGKINGWAETDLVTEFGLAPRANVHFLMTTGQISIGQAALYVAETTSGKFGVYTMGPRPDGQPGFVIKRHDMVAFRADR